MLNSRQRAQLRGMANGFDTIFQVGKSGIVEKFINQINEALEARELIKLRVLENSGITAREAAEEIAAKTSSDVVQVIGTKFIIYRQSSVKENRKIVLVK